ncbi:MAG: AMIN domain-containing protein, partial [Acidobacteria bacterium]|nr:AMIN domain-containing protein [Acidobacteriota bacterium]
MRVLCFFVCSAAALWLFVRPVVAETSVEKLELARRYFEQAQEAHQSLAAKPTEERTRQDYLRVIQAFRRVYYTTHLYGNNTVCLMAMAELYQEAGRRWGQKKDFESAIDALEFLIREYPHSRYLVEAHLTAARIYQSDLSQPQEALKRYQAFLNKYPRSSRADEARQAVDALQKGLKAPPQPGVETAAAPVPSESAQKAPASAGKLSQITNIRHWATPDYTRVVIEAEEEVRYGIQRLANPPRIYVDLYQTTINRAVRDKTIPVEYELLKSIRTGQPSPGVSRVVLDVGHISDYSVFELPNPYRLVI